MYSKERKSAGLEHSIWALAAMSLSAGCASVQTTSQGVHVYDEGILSTIAQPEVTDDPPAENSTSTQPIEIDRAQITATISRFSLQ